MPGSSIEPNFIAAKRKVTPRCNFNQKVKAGGSKDPRKLQPYLGLLASATDFRVPVLRQPGLKFHSLLLHVVLLKLFGTSRIMLNTGEYEVVTKNSSLWNSQLNICCAISNQIKSRVGVVKRLLHVRSFNQYLSGFNCAVLQSMEK